MKKQRISLLVMAILLSSSAMADNGGGNGNGNGNNNGPDNSVNSPTTALSDSAASSASASISGSSSDSKADVYGSVNSYQFINDSDVRHQVGDISCSAPSMTLGIAGNPSDSDDSMFYTSFNYPFGGSTCEDAQKFSYHTMQVKQRQSEILFQDRLANICVALSESVVIAENNLLTEECKDFTIK